MGDPDSTGQGGRWRPSGRGVPSGAARASCVLALAAGCTPLGGARRTDPLATRSQHPAQLTVQRLLPVAADALAPGAVRARWTNAYTSLFLSGGDAAVGNTFEMDGELLRTSVGARFGLGGGFEFDVEFPFGHASGGVLDDFVIDWHDWFGLPSQGRPAAPRDAFRVRAQRNGVTAYELEDDGFEPFDVPLEVAWTPLTHDPGRVPFDAKLRFGIELPVGDDDRGYGSGAVDYAVGAVVGRRFEGGYRLTAHVEHTWVGQPGPAQRAGLEFRDVTSAGISAAAPLWWDGWSFLAQVDWERSTLRSLGFSRVAKDQSSLWVGIRADLSSSTDLEIGFAEDLATFVGPDFTAWLALGHTFGRASE